MPGSASEGIGKPITTCVCGQPDSRRVRTPPCHAGTATRFIAPARMLPNAVELVRSGKPPRIEQDHGLATYCAKRTPDDGLIEAKILHRQNRAE